MLNSPVPSADIRSDSRARGLPRRPQAHDMFWKSTSVFVLITTAFVALVVTSLGGHPAFEEKHALMQQILFGAGGVIFLLGVLKAWRKIPGKEAGQNGFFCMADGRFWGFLFGVLGLIVYYSSQLTLIYAQEVQPIFVHAPPPSVPVVPTHQPVVFPEVRMQGVFFRASRPVVILEGQPYEVGDQVGEAKITAIDRSSVTLSLAGEEKKLTMKQSTSTKPKRQ